MIAVPTRAERYALTACLLFFLMGQAFIPRLGIQNDEALFAAPLLQPRMGMYIRIGHSQFPLMVMSYLGTLKTWIYRPILKAAGTNAWTVREPVLLAGSVSIWLFYLLLRRSAGERAALSGCFLLAFDPMYLLTTCFDWGPVALQHLLLVAGMFLLVRFYQDRGQWSLAGGFFLFGLALWDKALAAWMLSGIGIAAALVYWRQILSVITWRRIAISLFAFLVGFLPLLVYNADQSGSTFRGNFIVDKDDYPGKARMLVNTITGSALFGYLNAEDSATLEPHKPQGLMQRTSAAISALAGHPQNDLMGYTLGLAILLTPFTRGNALRAILFSLVAIVVAWLQMAITAKAGGAVHHTILLWPLPELLIAVCFADLSRRSGGKGIPILAVAIAAVTISSALVTNEYHAVMVRNGGSIGWSDAIYRLSDYMKGATLKNLYCADWGIANSLRLLSRGTLPLRAGMDWISDGEWSAANKSAAKGLLSDSGNVFVGHPKGSEFLPRGSKALARAAVDFGYKRQLIQSIADTNGRTVFEVYRFVEMQADAVHTPRPNNRFQKPR